jgi:DnaB-like helicase N terminal domain
VLEAERELLASCLTNPAVHAELAGWLTPTDFSRPEHAATWAAFNALAQAGTPIDYVTLAWQCQRHNPDHNSPGLSADQLATMGHHPPGSPGPAVATVTHASLLRHTDAAHDHVQAIAEDRSADALTVVSGLRRREGLPGCRRTRPPTFRHQRRKSDQRGAQSHQPAIRTVTTLVNPTTHTTPRRITPSHQVTPPRNSRCIRNSAKCVDLAVGAAPGRVRCTTW